MYPYPIPDAESDETWMDGGEKWQQKTQMRLNAAWRSSNHSSEIDLMGSFFKLTWHWIG
jgi:hypothetical protein